MFNGDKRLEREKPIELSEMYELISWPTRPNDIRARERFNNIYRFAKDFLEKEIGLKKIGKKKRFRLLDVMDASGIAGISFSKALIEIGARVELTLLDIREKELGYSIEWLKFAGLKKQN